LITSALHIAFRFTTALSLRIERVSPTCFRITNPNSLVLTIVQWFTIRECRLLRLFTDIDRINSFYICFYVLGYNIITHSEAQHLDTYHWCNEHIYIIIFTIEALSTNHLWSSIVIIILFIYGKICLHYCVQNMFKVWLCWQNLFNSVSIIFLILSPLFLVKIHNNIDLSCFQKRAITWFVKVWFCLCISYS